MGRDSRDDSSFGGTYTAPAKKTAAKGVIGEVSKIEEELKELKEAERLEDPVNQLTEARDIIGAVAAYIEKRFPRTDFMKLCRGALVVNKERAG